jgi:hypothetical protein
MLDLERDGRGLDVASLGPRAAGEDASLLRGRFPGIPWVTFRTERAGG